MSNSIIDAQEELHKWRMLYDFDYQMNYYANRALRKFVLNKLELKTKSK